MFELTINKTYQYFVDAVLPNHCNSFSTFDQQYVITLKKSNKSDDTISRMGPENISLYRIYDN